MSEIFYPIDWLYEIKIPGTAVSYKVVRLDQETLIGFNVHTKVEAGKEVQNYLEVAKKLMRMSIKEIHGVVLPNGTPYKLEFENNMLTEKCLNELFMMKSTQKLIESLMKVNAGDLSDVYDPNTGEVIEGVKVKIPKKKKSSRKA